MIKYTQILSALVDSSFISQYWLEALFACVLTTLSFIVKKMWNMLKKERCERGSLILCMRALIRDRLYQSCTFYMTRKWVTPEDLENLKFMYENYHNLGGNGTGTLLYQRVLELEVKKEFPDAYEDILRPAPHC